VHPQERTGTAVKTIVTALSADIYRELGEPLFVKLWTGLDSGRQSRSVILHGLSLFSRYQRPGSAAVVLLDVLRLATPEISNVNAKFCSGQWSEDIVV
jgi:hypothetical protein